MHTISLEELIMAVRRQSQGFSRGTSTYRGVTHHPSGKSFLLFNIRVWEYLVDFLSSSFV
jgi:hypothetical protein